MSYDAAIGALPVGLHPSDTSTRKTLEWCAIGQTVGWYDCISAAFDHQWLIDSQIVKGGGGRWCVSECVCWGHYRGNQYPDPMRRNKNEHKLGHMGDRRPPAGLTGPFAPLTARYVTYSFCSTVWLPLLLEQRPVWECKQQGKL